MIRKQVYIHDAQERFLKRSADQLGVTEAELVRRAIDSLAGLPSRPAFDPTAWEAVLALFEERQGVPVASSGESRTWTRADLYEDRLGHIPC